MASSQKKIARMSYHSKSPVLDDSQHKKDGKAIQNTWELTYPHRSHAESETRTTEQTQ